MERRANGGNEMEQEVYRYSGHPMRRPVVPYELYVEHMTPCERRPTKFHPGVLAQRAANTPIPKELFHPHTRPVEAHAGAVGNLIRLKENPSPIDFVSNERRDDADGPATSM